MKKKKMIIICVLVLLIVLWSYLVNTNKLVGFDDGIYNFVMKFKSDSFTSFMQTFTKIFSIKGAVIFCVLSLILMFFKYNGTFLLVCEASLATIINLIIKSIIKRPRPEHLRLVTETGYSFPSGHAMTFSMLFMFIMYLISKTKLNKYIKILLYILLTLLILFIGFSRVYVGVHYPTDIIGGYLCSILILYISINIIEKRKWL